MITHHFDNDEEPQVYAREQVLRAGEEVMTHVHRFDHLSIGSGGPVVVTVDGVSTEYSGTFCIRILAGKRHKIVALGDSHWFCIHATQERDVSKLEAALSLGE